MGKSIEEILESVKIALQKSKPLTAEENGTSQVLIEKLKTMDSDYRKKTALPSTDFSSVPETLGLTPKTYTETTEDELIEKAKLALDPAYTGKVDKLETATQSALDKLETSAKDSQSDYLEDAQKLESEEKVLTEAHKNNMIVQGLVNSSVNQTVKSDVKSLFDAQKTAILADFDQRTDEIEAKIALTQVSFDQALIQYDLQYAADLETKLSALKVQQEKLKEEVNAYNKKIAEQEIKYQQERLDQLAALEEQRAVKQAEADAQTAAYESEYGYSGDKADEMESRYQLAYNTYSQMDKDTAKKLINEQSEALKDTLGLYYQRLIAAFSS